MDSASTGGHALLLGAGIGIFFFLLILACIGLLVGALARFLLPGPDPMGLPATMGYGLAGSLLGGAVGRVLHIQQYAGFFLAIAGAAFLIWWFTRRGKAAAG
jgi:uncharacterized membrane protein YeaQ/YmgE (transglycosylase-associated protein family)